MTVVALASPGTGKSTTISRIIEAMHSVPDQEHEVNFLVLTFTKKTRSDLLRKFTKLSLSSFLRKKMISRIKNFHALANDMLKWSGIIFENKESSFTRRFVAERRL
jgi:superfamily I DNA/RNA helicase